MQQKYPEIRRLGSELLAISPMLESIARAMKKKLGLPFPVLCDRKNRVAEKFGLVYTLAADLQPIYSRAGIDLQAANGETDWRLPLPATYIVARDGTVVFRFVDTDYTARLDPEELLSELSGLRRL